MKRKAGPSGVATAEQGCGRFDERLSAFVDGALDENESAQIEAHLSECARCAAEARGLAQTLLVLRGASRGAEKPERFWSDFERSVRLAHASGHSGVDPKSHTKSDTKSDSASVTIKGTMALAQGWWRRRIWRWSLALTTAAALLLTIRLEVHRWTRAPIATSVPNARSPHAPAEAIPHTDEAQAADDPETEAEQEMESDTDELIENLGADDLKRVGAALGGGA